MHHRWSSNLAWLIASLLLFLVPAIAGTIMVDPFNRAYTCSSTAVASLVSQSSTADATSYTFSGVSIGVPPCAGSERRIIAIAGCNAITANAGNNPTVTMNGNAMTRIDADINSTNPTGLYSIVDNSLTGLGNFVFTVGGAGADVTCERSAMMIWKVITATGSATVDQVSDASPTGDFDLANVAVTLNGAEIVGIIAQSATACDLIDPTFGGTEVVTEDTNGTVETALSYRGGSFVADSTATVDDYTNISCGTETDGFATAYSFAPPG